MTEFILKYDEKQNEKVYLIGEPKELGGWDLSKRVELLKSKGFWVKKIEVNEKMEKFKYKYIIYNENKLYKWEKINRIFEKSQIEEFGENDSGNWVNDKAVTRLFWKKHKIESKESELIASVLPGEGCSLEIFKENLQIYSQDFNKTNFIIEFKKDQK